MVSLTERSESEGARVGGEGRVEMGYGRRGTGVTPLVVQPLNGGKKGDRDEPRRVNTTYPNFLSSPPSLRREGLLVRFSLILGEWSRTVVPRALKR